MMNKKNYTLNDLGELLVKRAKKARSPQVYRYAYNNICDLLNGPLAGGQSPEQLQELINRKCAEVSEQL